MIGRESTSILTRAQQPMPVLLYCKPAGFPYSHSGILGTRGFVSKNRRRRIGVDSIVPKGITGRWTASQRMKSSSYSSQRVRKDRMLSAEAGNRRRAIYRTTSKQISHQSLITLFTLLYYDYSIVNNSNKFGRTRARR